MIKYRFYKLKESFINDLQSGIIQPTDFTIIAETSEIFTHNQYFGGDASSGAFNPTKLEITIPASAWKNQVGTQIGDLAYGESLQGRTIKFNTNKPVVKSSVGNEGIIIFSDGLWAFHVEVYDTDIILYANGEIVYRETEGGWKVDSYTFPESMEATVVYTQPGTPLDLTGNNFKPLEDIMVTGLNGKGEWSADITVNGITVDTIFTAVPTVGTERHYNTAGVYKEIDTNANTIIVYSLNQPTNDIHLRLQILKL